MSNFVRVLYRLLRNYLNPLAPKRMCKLRWINVISAFNEQASLSNLSLGSYDEYENDPMLITKDYLVNHFNEDQELIVLSYTQSSCREKSSEALL